ncbi:hypothetical protein K488DRAFT_83245 [Vararia minispora EC-137]|uniref:Uncharacterized protein n=1 Tax=Vararia minispora EC-137 TaxID=1314806 RepID=A0ACB8QUB7_9AGAM|nr:hypothetical protein K488DRAFT_83245 [Vararia minispora EC-137]
MSDRFTSLPAELLEYSFTFVDPVDIAAINQTSKVLHSITAPSNIYLWRSIYLSHPFDDPRPHMPDAAAKFDWRDVLTRRVRAERRVIDNVVPFLDTVAECLSMVPPHSSTPSADIAWVNRVVSKRSDLFRDELPTRSTSSSEDGSDDWEDIQVDLSLDDPIAKERRMFIRASLAQKLRPDIASASAAARRRAARTFVYDMRNYVPSSQWGPLMPGAAAPRWQHIDALISVVSANLRDFGPEWPGELQPPALRRGAETLRAYSALLEDERSPIDWAGVGGEWMRISARSSHGTRAVTQRGHCRSSFFHDEFEEATRLLRMHLVVTGIAEDELSADPTRPALRFKGRMRGFSSHENLDREVRGVVRVMPSGNIRWTSVSIYQGQKQWSSEGIQLGGPGSAAGVIGAWSGALHAASDPAGPFWSFRPNERNIVDKIMSWPF